MRHVMKRREFLTIPASALGGTLLYTLAREPFRLQAQEGNVKVPLRFFTAGEARVIAAACERIFPSDASGPGAKGSRGYDYRIDQQLSGQPAAPTKYRYAKGPLVESSSPSMDLSVQGKSTRGRINKEIAKTEASAPIKLPVEEQIQKLQSP